jgi:transposase
VREDGQKVQRVRQGHEGKTLKQVENPNTIVDHYPSACAGCGEALGLEQATGYRKRQVFDLPKPQPVEVTEHRAHHCACSHCGTKTNAVFPEDVTAAAQYGTNIAALAVYLAHWHFIPEDRLAGLMKDVFGIDLTTATIAAMAQRKADEWKPLADDIGEQVKQADVKHMDETGLRVAGVLQWLQALQNTWRPHGC